MKKVITVLALLGACLVSRVAAQSNQLSPALTPISAALTEIDGVTALNAQVTISWASCKVRGVAIPDGKMLVQVVAGTFATSLPPCDTLYTVTLQSQGSQMAMFWKVPDTAATQNLSNIIALDPPGSQKALTFSCGTAAACSPTNTSTTLKQFYGSVALTSGTPSTATVTGLSPAFTSSSSYFCVVTDTTTQANPAKVANVSGSSFTITGAATNTDVINYFCQGI